MAIFWNGLQQTTRKLTNMEDFKAAVKTTLLNEETGLQLINKAFGPSKMLTIPDSTQWLAIVLLRMGAASSYFARASLTFNSFLLTFWFILVIKMK